MGKRLQTAILFIPGFSIYAVLILFSIVLCFYYSFFDWDGIRTSMNFVGFSNYIRILKQPAFLNSLRVTFFFAVLGTFAVNTIALFLSLQLNKPGKLTYFYRSAFFFPQLISLIAVGFIFKSLLSYIGVVNTWLEKWGLPLVDFLGSPAIAKWSVLFVTIWQITGFGTVLYLAGLQAIPKVLYDSALMDGVSPWQQFFSVTFPWLAPAFTSVTVFVFTVYMRIFDFIFVLTGGGPVNSTESISVLVIRIGFNQYKISYASAISIYFLILVASISMTLTYFLRKREIDLQG